MCSLCHNGILGGALYIDDTTIKYKTQKLTVNKEYKQIVLPLNEIENILWKWIIFPIATFYMANGKQYKFIIFNKRRFKKCYQEICGD